MTPQLITRILTLAVLVAPLAATADHNDSIPTRHNEATVAQLQATMASRAASLPNNSRASTSRASSGSISAVPGVNSVIELNPDALAMARRADFLRRHGPGARAIARHSGAAQGQYRHRRSDADRLRARSRSAGAPALRDSTVAAKLRAGGAVILGKTNLSEWANFRSFFSSSGWSARRRADP